MDPQATWDQLLAALAEEDWDRAEELAFALGEWLRKGGFAPTILGIANLSPDLDRVLAQASCSFILDRITRREPAGTAKGADR